VIPVEDEDQTEDSTSPVEVDVQVTVPETESEPVAETPTVVVVEDAADNAPTDAVVVETAIDHEGRLAAIESRLNSLELTAHEALATAQIAEAVATLEPEPAPVIIEETPQEPAEEDSAPNNKHWWFK